MITNRKLPQTEIKLTERRVILLVFKETSPTNQTKDTKLERILTISAMKSQSLRKRSSRISMKLPD